MMMQVNNTNSTLTSSVHYMYMLLYLPEGDIFSRVLILENESKITVLSEISRFSLFYVSKLTFSKHLYQKNVKSPKKYTCENKLCHLKV